MLTEVRPEVELMVTAGDIPEKLVVDLDRHRHQRHDPHLRRRRCPPAPRPTITDRDFVIANIQAPSGLRSEESEDEAAEAEG